MPGHICHFLALINYCTLNNIPERVYTGNILGSFYYSNIVCMKKFGLCVDSMHGNLFLPEDVCSCQGEHCWSSFDKSEKITLMMSSEISQACKNTFRKPVLQTGGFKDMGIYQALRFK